jgi:hypothetical protein
MHQAALRPCQAAVSARQGAVVLSEKRLAELILVPLGNRCLEGVVDVFQQGQVFRLTSTGLKRVQRGGFASEEDARAALERALERLRREGGIGRTRRVRR